MMKDVETLHFVWKQIGRAIEAHNDLMCLPPEDYVISAINDSNIELAQKLISDYKLI